MQSLSAFDLLTLWENGLPQPSFQRALSLLASAFPETPPATLAALPIGQRDTCLLTLRAWTFGPRLNSLATCPACGARLELAFDVADILAGRLPDLHESELPAPKETLSLAEDGYTVTFRLPNSVDLATLADHPDPSPLHLLESCLLHAVYAETPIRADQLPENVVRAIAEQMAVADPQADVQIALTCPCGHPWQATFDILSFFWAELHAWAQRILREIHLLASVYGWSEMDILALPPARRAMYLQMVTNG
jgi:hypothetical protein